MIGINFSFIRKKYLPLVFLAFFISSSSGNENRKLNEKITTQGWNLLSDNYDKALLALDASGEYEINHLQLSHKVIMNLKDVKDEAKRNQVIKFVEQAHKSGIPEVVIWDHALYDLGYYPERFKTGPNNTIDLDNPEFWIWLQDDYRSMLRLVPQVDGLVLTFIETGARAENQFSKTLHNSSEKLAAVVNAIAQVVISEFKKKLIIRTFAYTIQEYQTTIGCINHLKNKEIILMMKETPHDFFLTHPNDPYAGVIEWPTIIEFDTANEFNGQGLIANTWPEYVLKRWNYFKTKKNVVGYVARTDRYGDTQIVGTPAEILLYTLKASTSKPKITSDQIYNEFIGQRYGKQTLPLIKPAMENAFDIVTSVLYTLGTNTANHSSLNYDPYPSSYARHVSGKWLTPPEVNITHRVNKRFHYWKDVINHIAPARLKMADGPIRVEAPEVIENHWVQPSELMDSVFLSYIVREKEFGVQKAEESLRNIMAVKQHLTARNYAQLYNTFYRTLLTARLHCAVAQSYFAFRVYARDKRSQSVYVMNMVSAGLNGLQSAVKDIKHFKGDTPEGQWKWAADTTMALDYYKKITSGWAEYSSEPFQMNSVDRSNR